MRSPGQGPIEEGDQAYSWVWGQSKEGTKHIPGSGVIRRRGASIFPGQGSIEGGERAYSKVRGQSKEGSKHIPGSGVNRRRGASIFP
eukprot:365003-Prorocentrum_minimum.AAC.2